MNTNQMEVTESILKNYPDIILTLTGRDAHINLKSDGRILRRDSERIRKSKRFRRHPYERIKQFKKALSRAMENKSHTLFMCPACKNVLSTPVTVECGHTFCTDCLDKNPENCAKCFMDLAGQKPNVNILVQSLIEKWRDRSKRSNVDVPEAVDILGLHPRYILRSGYAGLQFTIDNEKYKEESEVENKIGYVDCMNKEIYKSPTKSRRTRKYFEKYYKENHRGDDYFQEMLDNIFKEVDSIKEKALRVSWNCITPEDVECLLCSRCLLDPVTTSCGHTFCRDCLTRVLDHRLSCPLCMSALSVCDYFKGTTEVLDQAIRFIIPEEIHYRLQTNLGDSIVNGSAEVPVFICTNAFPGVACPLYVYEPRYRLLVRRCLQSSTKTFAMTSIDPAGTKFVQYGTILEVKDAITLNDGRIILTTLGVRRFKVISKDEQDGYDTAKIEHINDINPPPEKLPDLVFLHQKVFCKAAKWVRLLTPAVLSEVERLIGTMPKIEKDWFNLPDGPSWTWWLMPILPLSSQLQVGFLSSTSLEKRLRAIDKMLEHMKIRMKALQREETVTCSRQDENMDFCSQSQNC